MSEFSEVAHALGYRSAYWSLDTLDSVRPAKNSLFITSRVTTQPDEVLDGAIVLFHVGNVSTAHAIPDILRVLRTRNVEVVSVSVLVPALSKNEGT